MEFLRDAAGEPTALEHVVQLFDSVESLAETVADFARDGLLADEVVLIVVRPEAWTRIANRLGRNAVDVRRAMDRGQLVVLDAVETLAKIAGQSWPDRLRFDAVIGDLVRDLAARGRLRVYGEVVDVLAADAQFHAAIALEELWNALARTVAFKLLCGYSAVHFGSERSSEALRSICRCHSAMHVEERDDLAAWLLTPPQTDGALPS
jgi:hypothetical protein